MYGPGTEISVIAVPTGIAPLVVGSGGGEAVGGVKALAENESVGDVVRPGDGVAGESVTGESPDTFMDACRLPLRTTPRRCLKERTCELKERTCALGGGPASRRDPSPPVSAALETRADLEPRATSAAR